MRKFFALVALFALLTTLAAPVSADRRPYVFDRSHSQINFVAEALLITAHGYFERWDGEIQIDRANLENSTVSISIETASINTQIGMRDNDLRSARFFDAQNFPKITFVSTKVAKVDDKNLRVTGDITVKGVTKSIEVPVRIVFQREGDARFKSEFQINRQDFGVSHNSTMNPIEDLVTVQLDFHLVDKEAAEQRRQQQQQRQQQPPPAKQPPTR